MRRLVISAMSDLSVEYRGLGLIDHGRTRGFGSRSGQRPLPWQRPTAQAARPSAQVARPSRSFGCGGRQHREKPGLDEAGRLAGVDGHVALGVPAPLVAGARVTDRVFGVAVIDGLGAEQLALRRDRAAAAVGRVTEGGHRDDVVGVLGRQRTAPADAADGNPGDDVDHRRALRVSAEHLRGVRALVGHVFDVLDGVVGTVTAVQLQQAGLVVDRVGVDVLAGVLAQVVGKGLADVAQSGRFVGTAGEGQGNVRAVVGAGRRDGGRNGGRGDQQDAGGQQRGGAQRRASGSRVTSDPSWPAGTPNG